MAIDIRFLLSDCAEIFFGHVLVLTDPKNAKNNVSVCPILQFTFLVVAVTDLTQ